ncbi:GDA1/CD39 nucleoside phosphatase family protein [Quillaja saponaria]|nr:GDA1/CD39 nucleoside phosphatase family protein [Quillaja saponaria]
MYRKSWIRVLSGSEEAYYGWVALNYKMGIFGNYSSSPTLGLLDLGGSSLQVVMEIDERSDDMHIIRSKLGSIESQILAYSLPAFGLNEAFDRTVMMLSHNQSREITGYRSELRHPCLSSDFVQNYTCYSCSGLDVNNQENHAQLQKDELPSFYLVGDQNWDQCKEIATAAAINSSTINLSRPAVGKNGSGIINLNAVGQPTTRFHALSGFFVVYNMLDLSPKANLTKLWDLGQRLCSESQAGLSSISANPNYAGHFCFRLPFMTSLIENALCLGDTDIIFGPGDVSWTVRSCAG